jgi:hypothetical protein
MNREGQATGGGTAADALGKVLIVAPAFLSWDLGTYLFNLLTRRGTPCETFAYRSWPDEASVNRALEETVLATRPDTILGLKMAVFDPDTLHRLRETGAFTVLWYVDCFDATVPSRIGRLVPAVDLFLCTAKGMLPAYRSLSDTPCHWLVEGAYLPAFPQVELSAGERTLYEADVAFIGNIFHPPVGDTGLALRRYHLLNRIADRFRLKIWGPQGDRDVRERWGRSDVPIIDWPAYHEEVVRICRASRVVLGINTINSVELYFSNRTFLTLASGGFHLTHYVPGLESMFENGRHLVWYRNDEECLSLLEHFLDRPQARAEIAARGRDRVRGKFDMDAQIDRISELVERYRAG